MLIFGWISGRIFDRVWFDKFLILACLRARSVPKVTNPKTASKVLVSDGIRFNNSIILGMNADGRPEIPKTRSRRPNGITIDAAEMNPTRTGWEMKFTTPPRLKTPKNKMIQPMTVKLMKSFVKIYAKLSKTNENLCFFNRNWAHAK